MAAAFPHPSPSQHPGAIAPEPDGLTLSEVAAAARVPQGALRHARELGILPAADIDGTQWSPAAVREITGRWPQISAELARNEELGAVRCAELLGRITGLAVTSAHIDHLAARGILRARRQFRNRPLYRTADVHALAADPVSHALLTEIAPYRAS